MAGRNKRTADGTPIVTRRSENARREEMERTQAENPEQFSRGRDTGVDQQRLHAEERDQVEGGDDRLTPRRNEDQSEG